MNTVGSMLAGGAGFLVFGFAMPLALRIFRRIAPMRLFAAAGLVIHLAATAGGLALVPDFNYWPGVAVFWFGFMVYLFVYSAFYKAVSLRILGRLAQQPDRGLTRAELYDGYIHPSFTDRMAILVDGGLVERRKEIFVLTERGRKVAGRLAKVQGILGIERIGFYSDAAANTDCRR